MSIFFKLFLSLIFFFNHLNAKEGDEVLIVKGYLGESELQELKQKLHKFDRAQSLFIEVDSNSGDLLKVLELAKSIYLIKNQHQTKITVYIENEAVGPAAIFPFLADQLYVSPYSLWGNIQLDNEKILPTNLIKSSVVSLIPQDRQEGSLLENLAFAMIDPLFTFDAADKRLESLKNHDESKSLDASSTLVLNRHQILDLGLAKSSLTKKEFETQFNVAIDKDRLNLKQENASAERLKNFREHIKFSQTEENKIGYIAIDDRGSAISQSTWIYVKKALDFYKTINPAFIILKLNTPGGEVFSAQQISDALKEIDLKYNIPVVAFIDDWAISAGAMIAYSCRFITSVKEGSMGAAEPVIIGQDGQMQSASEKVNSVLRTDFANRAKIFDRNPDIAEAMVDKDMILVYRHGKIVRLAHKDQMKLNGADPDIIIAKESKLLTLNGEEMLSYGVADLLVGANRTEEINPEEQAEGVWPFSKEPLSKALFFEEIPDGKVYAFKMDWKTAFLAFLTTPAVASLLMLGMFMGFYWEMSSPGFGLGGGIALICLVLVIISNLSLEIANVLDLIFVLVGIGLILVELAFFHTGGILAIVGLFFFIVGLFAVSLPSIKSVDFEFATGTFNAAGEEFLRRLAWLCGTIVLSSVLIAFLSRYISPSFMGLKRLVLAGGEQDASRGYISGNNPADLPPVGSQGEAMSTLRPSGKIIIQDKVYDAVTSGDFIEQGKAIIVKEHDGSVIVVMIDGEV